MPPTVEGLPSFDGKSDAELLIEILRFAQRYLAVIASDSELIRDVRYREVLNEGWIDLQPIFGAVIDAISELNTEGSAFRDQFRLVGLTGVQLRMKYRLLAWDISKGLIKKILERLNSILSSLGIALGGLGDAIKEWKDQLEASLDDDD